MPRYVYGWKPPRPEQIAAAPQYPLSYRLAANRPSSADLRPKLPPPWDQGKASSCTAHMTAGMIVYDQAVHNSPIVMPSRLYDYYNSRALSSQVITDGGCSIADSVTAIAREGWIAETEWEYNLANVNAKPPAVCYEHGKPNRISDYYHVPQTLDHLCGALAAGEPVGIGIAIYPSFESDDVALSGVVRMPSLAEQMGPTIGGHAILLCGYDDLTRRFLFRNSWGLWGSKGYGWLPYDYVLSPSLATDFWVIRSLATAGEMAYLAALDAGRNVLWKVPVRFGRPAFGNGLSIFGVAYVAGLDSSERILWTFPS